MIRDVFRIDSLETKYSHDVHGNSDDNKQIIGNSAIHKYADSAF
jgi:hypothetical protein